MTPPRLSCPSPQSSLRTSKELSKHALNGGMTHLLTFRNSARQPGLRRKTAEARGAIGLGMTFGTVCEKLWAAGTHEL